MNNDDSLKDIIDAKPIKLTPQAQPAPGDDTIEADNITMTYTLTRKDLEAHMRKLYEMTSADKFDTAVSLAWYKFDPTKDRDTANMMSLLTVLARCEQDGAIKPPVSLSEMYAVAAGKINPGQGKQFPGAGGGPTMISGVRG
ncbi:MAG: hypothetical protein AB1553_04545 [Nitrospirota bacterium]